jgi:hypothetical protein
MRNKGIGTSATQSQLAAQKLPEQSRIAAPFTEEIPNNIAGVLDSSCSANNFPKGHSQRGWWHVNFRRNGHEERKAVEVKMSS